LTLGIIFSVILSASGVSAGTIVLTPQVPKNLQVSKTANNNYTIQIGTNVVPLGSATTSFTPKMVFPDWTGYAWNAQLGLDNGWICIGSSGISLNSGDAVPYVITLSSKNPVTSGVNLDFTITLTAKDGIDVQHILTCYGEIIVK
jgi:hypothetical protein